MPLSLSGALVLQADVRSDIALDVAGYFSTVAGDDGNGPGLLWNPFVRQGIAASGEIYETEFASLLVRGTGLLPPEARAMSGRILYAAGGESDGSQISVSPTGLYAGSWGTDVRGTGYPDTVDETTFVRRLSPGGALYVGPGGPDLTYARATLDAFGYYIMPGL